MKGKILPDQQLEEHRLKQSKEKQQQQQKDKRHQRKCEKSEHEQQNPTDSILNDDDKTDSNTGDNTDNTADNKRDDTTTKNTSAARISRSTCSNNITTTSNALALPIPVPRSIRNAATINTRSRRPNGSTDAFIKRVAASTNPRICPCPVANCLFPVFTHNLHRLNRKKPELDVPRQQDGSVDWSYEAWKPIRSGHSWNNYLKTVIGHFEYEIENGSKEHILRCPEVIRVRAELDLTRTKKNPERSKYHKLRILLNITNDGTT